jgi:hypothetical protein
VGIHTYGHLTLDQILGKLYQNNDNLVMSIDICKNTDNFDITPILKKIKKNTQTRE